MKPHRRNTKSFGFELKVASWLVEAEKSIRAICGEKRYIWGRLRPKSAYEVREIIQAARIHKVKLHAYSTGLNWGFGSSLPAEFGCYVVDLSLLRNIRFEGDFVQIEPGVTQGQLDEFLRYYKPDYYFNVTGAGCGTSLLGNALERGIGYFGIRNQDIMEMEIALGNGQVIKVGSVYQTQLGPELTGLFVQSQFGIVLNAKLRLRKRAEMMGRITVGFDSRQSFLQGLEVLKDCLHEHLIHSIPHGFNKTRMKTTLLPYCNEQEAKALSIPLWSLVIPVEGPCKVIEELAAILVNRFEKHGLVSQDIRNSKIKVDSNWSSQQRLSLLALGHPTDLALASVSQAALGYVTEAGRIKDQGRAGIIQITPCFPLRQDVLDQALDYLEQEGSQKFHGELPLSLNVLDGYRAVLVISVPVDHQDEVGAKQARDFARKTVAHFAHQGYFPYRLGLLWSDVLPPLPTAVGALIAQIALHCDPDQIFTSKYNQRWNVDVSSPERLHGLQEVLS